MGITRDLVEADRTIPAYLTRNKLINGGFNISQRGDFSNGVGVGAQVYYLDRFEVFINTITTQLKHLSDNQPQGRKTKSARLTATSNGTGVINHYQRIEFPERMNDKTVTLSAWVKSNNINARLSTYDGSFTCSEAHTGNGEWEKLSMTVKLRGDITDLRACYAIFSNVAGNVAISAGDFIEATEIQLEEGARDTPFEQRLEGHELALCQRYYYELPTFSFTFDSGSISAASWLNTYPTRRTISHPTTMRVQPTLYFASIQDGFGGQVGRYANTKFFEVQLLGPVVGGSPYIYTERPQFDAEL